MKKISLPPFAKMNMRTMERILWYYYIHHDSTWRTCGYVTRIPENVANRWVEIYKITQIVTALANHPMWSCCRCNASLTLHSRETSWILLLITVEYTFSFATAYFRQWWRKCNRLFMVSSCGVEMEHRTLWSPGPVLWGAHCWHQCRHCKIWPNGFLLSLRLRQAPSCSKFVLISETSIPFNDLIKTSFRSGGVRTTGSLGSV